MIKQTVLVICWFAEDRFEYKEVWCLRETLLTVNWNFDVQNTNVWRALHVLKGDGCLFHVCIQQSFLSIDWFCDNAFISIQFLLKDYLSIFLKFLLTARQLLIEINLVIMRKKDLIDKKMIADHFLSAHFKYLFIHINTIFKSVSISIQLHKMCHDGSNLPIHLCFILILIMY